MKLTTSLTGVALGCAALLVGMSAAFAGDVAGTYTRPNGKTATVSMCEDGGLHAVAANGTVMFKCAKKVGNVWKDDGMKHPEFPGTFKGTITPTATGLNVEGCFGFVCPSESWTNKK
jgi:hypothetical protein